jgi:hypothetical protein
MYGPQKPIRVVKVAQKEYSMARGVTEQPFVQGIYMLRPGTPVQELCIRPTTVPRDHIVMKSNEATVGHIYLGCKCKHWKDLKVWPWTVLYIDHEQSKCLLKTSFRFAVCFTKQYVRSPSSMANPLLHTRECYMFRPFLRAIIRQWIQNKKKVMLYGKCTYCWMRSKCCLKKWIYTKHTSLMFMRWDSEEEEY